MFPTTALINNLPSEWSSEYYENTRRFLVPIEKYCSEYQNNAAKVSESFNGGITSIRRVQNHFLYARFLLKQEEYRSRGINFEIKELFHDTGAGKVKSIVRDNFDWRLTRRNKFGKGVSFSPSPSYANKQSSWLSGTSRAMIITDVIVGNMDTGSQGQSLPSDGYDTTVGNRYKVFVKFYDDEFYPKYIVNYNNTPV